MGITQELHRGMGLLTSYKLYPLSEGAYRDLAAVSNLSRPPWASRMSLQEGQIGRV